MNRCIRFFLIIGMFLLNGSILEAMPLHSEWTDQAPRQMATIQADISDTLHNHIRLNDIENVSESAEDWITEEEEENESLHWAYTGQYTAEAPTSYQAKTAEYFCNYCKSRLSYFNYHSRSVEQQTLYLRYEVIRI